MAAAETTVRITMEAHPPMDREDLADRGAALVALLEAGQAGLGLPGEVTAAAAGLAVGIAATSSAKAGQGDTTTGMQNAHATRHALPFSRILSFGYVPGAVVRRWTR